MTPEAQSQVRFYWSVTLYTLPDLFLFGNPQHRYAISSRKPDLVRDGDGSITLHIQQHSPGAGREPNWIPAPAGPFLAGLRLYGPSDKIQTGEWHEPPLRKASS